MLYPDQIPTADDPIPWRPWSVVTLLVLIVAVIIALL